MVIVLASYRAMFRDENSEEYASIFGLEEVTTSVAENHVFSVDLSTLEWIKGDISKKADEALLEMKSGNNTSSLIKIVSLIDGFKDIKNECEAFVLTEDEQSSIDSMEKDINFIEDVEVKLVSRLRVEYSQPTTRRETVSQSLKKH